MNRSLEQMFEAIGARAAVTTTRSGAPIHLDVVRDSSGECFQLRRNRTTQVTVLDSSREDRHLLLQISAPGWWAEPATYMCGHDERAWFVAAIPETAKAQTLQEAKDALKPPAVWEAMRESGVPAEDRDLRRTRAFIRQGEWFFIPRPNLVVSRSQVLRMEPIRRGAGKPHVCQFLYRIDGEPVYVSEDHPNGLTLLQFRKLPRKRRLAQEWQHMYRNARVFVRGNVTHADHETVTLRIWHEVVQNMESNARSMQEMAFLD